MKNAVHAAGLAALACLSLAPFSAAIAAPSEYVHPAVVEEGEREIDFKAGSRKLRDGTRESAWSIGFGYGVNRWWFTELYGKWHKEPGEGHSFDAFEWENRFQLTETGRYPVDVGFLLEIERPRVRSEGYEVKFGPLFQADLTPRITGNLNFVLEKHLLTDEPQEKAELGYEWQVRYRWQPQFEFGLQGFGEVGPWNHWLPSSEQSHRLGPAIYGAVKVGERQVIKYNAGLLFGLTDGSPRNQIRLQAEYEF
jgi:hypothetical protein